MNSLKGNIMAKQKLSKEQFAKRLTRNPWAYRLTTAEILYHLPDYPSLLQSFVWQTMDKAPHFLLVRKFLDHWEAHLEGRIHSVKIASKQLIKPAEFRHIKHNWILQ